VISKKRSMLVLVYWDQEMVLFPKSFWTFEDSQMDVMWTWRRWVGLIPFAFLYPSFVEKMDYNSQGV